MFPKKQIKTIIFLLSTLMLMTLFINTVYALASDQIQKISILADSFHYQRYASIQLFDGHVQATQGATFLTADRLIIYLDQKREIKTIVAYGLHGLAHYWTQPKKEASALKAEAKIIQYDPKHDQVTLIDDALVTQDKNVLKGQKIVYNERKGTAHVFSTQGQRTILIYHPATSHVS